MSFQALWAQPVELDWIGKKPTFQTGVSWGVPFSKGEVERTQHFELKDTNGNSIPVQRWPLAYWPDGSVKWMGFAAAADPQDGYMLHRITGQNQTAGNLTVNESDRQVIINTGALTCVLNKQGQTLIEEIAVGGRVVSTDGQLVCQLEDRQESDRNILQYHDYIGSVDRVEVEQSGPIQAVVKITGAHQSVDGTRNILPFSVRLYFHTDLQNIRLVHSFVYDGDQEVDFIKGLGIAFGVPMREDYHNRHVRFSGDDGGLWSEPVKVLTTRAPFRYKNDLTLPARQAAGERLPEITSDDPEALRHFENLPAWNDYKLTQLTSNGFSIAKRTNEQSIWLHAAEGKRSNGWVLAGDVSGGLAVSLKDFWQSYPASLEVNDAAGDTAQLTVWLWSKEAASMDMRHYDTVAHDLLTTYEDVQEGLSTPYGVARTSELTLFAFDRLPGREESVQMAEAGTRKHQLICTPQYLYGQRAFGLWSLPDRSTAAKNQIEDELDRAILYYQQATEEHGWYGFWNYGDFMHTYDLNRHAWRYDVGGYAWANTELAPGNWLWYSFLRTGREDIFRMAEAMTRHTGEVDAYHIGPMKGLGTRHNVTHWGCGAKEARIGQAAWKRQYYYLTTDERCGDLMRESLDVEAALMEYEPLRIAQPRSEFPYNAPTRLRWGPDWLALAGNWLTEWERTGDRSYYDKIKTGLDCLASFPDGLFTGPGGLGYDPQTGILSYDGAPGVTNRNHLSTIMGGYEILTELFDMIDHPAFMERWIEYCGFYSMPDDDPVRTPENARWGNIGFLTPRLTAYAAHALDDGRMAARAWREFLRGRWSVEDWYASEEVLPPAVLNPIHENSWVSTNGVSQWGLNAIIMLELIGDKLPDTEKEAFTELSELDWKETFSDPMTGQWSENWSLDGQRAQLTNTAEGLLFRAGETPASDADHSVLWTNREFAGDIRIEFDLTRQDEATKYVNILYLFARGSGSGVYDPDISRWSALRSVPAMQTYFEHMNAYHISFAAFENDNDDPRADYIRFRRYLPERGKGLEGTELLPEYTHTGLFEPETPHHITVIRRGNDIFMHIQNPERDKLCHWDTTAFPPLAQGRIGLRLMGSRVSRIADFKVYEL